MTSLPPTVKEKIQQIVWSQADEMCWPKLGPVERTRAYENWSKDKNVGGVLSYYMDPRRVRVYLKDTLLKPYQLEKRIQDTPRIVRFLGIEPGETVGASTYSKPNGMRLADGRIIAWGRTRDWKSILMAAFERANRARGQRAFAVVFLEAEPSVDGDLRSLIELAAASLSVERCMWLD